MERDFLATVEGVSRGRKGAQRRALTARIARSWDVLVALAMSDMLDRYGRGRWQLIKWLADPFAVTGVYLMLVSFVLDRGGPAPGLSLACAIVPFQLVMMSATNAVSAVSNRRSILQNMAFDRTLLPISSVMTESVASAASAGLVIMMMSIYGVAPTLALLWLPLVIAATLAIALAFAYAAALVGVWYSDLRIFAVSLLRTLYFVAPGLVPLSEISGRANDLLKLNPLTGLFEAWRDVLLYGNRPGAWELLIPFGFAVAVLALLVPVYRREQVHFAKVVE